MVSNKQNDININNSSKTVYDMIVIGGGVYGVMLAYEASIMGKKVVVLEKDTFGSHTSSNSLRIIHGGLRYLQTLDLNRFFESVIERRWFLKTFQEQVSPLPCLMPLYNRGLHRPIILKAALVMNDILSKNRNMGVPKSNQIPDGQIISPENVVHLFPQVNQDGLSGGALWTDAFMQDPVSLIQAVIKKTQTQGGVFLESIKAVELLNKNNSVLGVKAFDSKDKKEITIHGNIVVNTAGPWCRQIAQTFDKDIPSLFYPSLAWNILFDRPALGKTALALTPKIKEGRTYFILPLNNKLFAGTGHGVWNYSNGVDKPCPDQNQIAEFISDLNTAIPGLELNNHHIDTVFSGLLPADKENSYQLKSKEVIIHHAPHINNFYSVSGVKFTTARRVAQKLLDRVYL